MSLSPAAVVAVVFTGTGLWVASAGAQVTAIENAHASAINVCVSSDGKWIASGGNKDCLLKVWSIEGRNVLSRKLKDGSVRCVALAPDGSLVAAGCAELVYLYDTRNGDLLLSYKAFSSKVNALAFSPDGRQLAIGSSAGKLQVLEIAEKKRRHAKRGHGTYFASLGFSADGKLIFGVGDNRLKVWDADTLEQTTKLKVRDFSEAGFLGDGGVWGISPPTMNDGPSRVCVWDTADGKELQRIEIAINEHDSARLSKDGRLLFVESDEIAVVSVETGQVLDAMPSASGAPFQDICLSDDSHALVAVQSGDHPTLDVFTSTIVIWDLKQMLQNLR
jgi:WD40 repeat protein